MRKLEMNFNVLLGLRDGLEVPPGAVSMDTNPFERLGDSGQLNSWGGVAQIVREHLPCCHWTDVGMIGGPPGLGPGGELTRVTHTKEVLACAIALSPGDDVLVNGTRYVEKF